MSALSDALLRYIDYHVRLPAAVSTTNASVWITNHVLKLFELQLNVTR